MLCINPAFNSETALCIFYICTRRYFYEGVIFLGFNVIKKTNCAVNADNIAKIYGRENSSIIKNPISTADMNIQNPVVNPPKPPVNPPIQQKTAVVRTRVQGDGAKLIRGQKWNIPADRLKIGIGWDCADSSCELDVSAFMLAQNGKVLDESWFVFYGQDRSPDKSVAYKSNADNSYSPDDAEMTVLLDSVSNNVNKITICLTIYEALQRGLNFSAVSNIYLRIMDVNGVELAKYQAEKLPSDITSLVVGELYRYNNTWKFCAVGEGFRKNLADFCNIYGVEIE